MKLSEVLDLVDNEINEEELNESIAEIAQQIATAIRSMPPSHAIVASLLFGVASSFSAIGLIDLLTKPEGTINYIRDRVIGKLPIIGKIPRLKKYLRDKKTIDKALKILKKDKYIRYFAKRYVEGKDTLKEFTEKIMYRLWDLTKEEGWFGAYHPEYKHLERHPLRKEVKKGMEKWVKKAKLVPELPED